MTDLRDRLSPVGTVAADASRLDPELENCKAVQPSQSHCSHAALVAEDLPPALNFGLIPATRVQSPADS